MTHRAILTFLLLIILLFSVETAHTEVNLELIMDGSGSMWEQKNEIYKIVIFRRALARFLSNSPENIKIGIRSFGAATQDNISDDCKNTHLVHVIQRNERDNLIKAMYSVNPKGKAPIAYAIKEGFQDFEDNNEKKIIIVIADGKDTCFETPCDWIVNEADNSKGIAVYTIGLQIENVEARKQLSCLAKTFNGSYYEVKDSEVLLWTLNKIMNAAIKEENKRLEIIEEERKKAEALQQRTRVAIEISNDLSPLLADSIKIDSLFIDNKSINVDKKKKILLGKRELIYENALSSGKHRLLLSYSKNNGASTVKSRMEEIEFTIKEGFTTLIYCSTQVGLFHYGCKTNVTIKD